MLIFNQVVLNFKKFSVKFNRLQVINFTSRSSILIFIQWTVQLNQTKTRPSVWVICCDINLLDVFTRACQNQLPSSRRRPPFRPDYHPSNLFIPVSRRATRVTWRWLGRLSGHTPTWWQWHLLRQPHRWSEEPNISRIENHIKNLFLRIRFLWASI